MRHVWLLGSALVACTQGPPQPASLDAKNEGCSFCRMAISDARFAAQLVAPAEEPRFFDDIGCLRDYLEATALPSEAVAYVADHRTKDWVRADRALYTKLHALETPMASHLIAHADAGSREADREAAGGTPLTAGDVFGPAGPPGGRAGR